MTICDVLALELNTYNVSLWTKQENENACIFYFELTNDQLKDVWDSHRKLIIHTA